MGNRGGRRGKPNDVPTTAITRKLYSPETTPSIGSNLFNPRSVIHPTIMTQLLTMKYPLYRQNVSGKEKSNSCPVCNTECETLTIKNSPPLQYLDNYSNPLSRHLQHLSLTLKNPSMIKKKNSTTDIVNCVTHFTPNEGIF